MADYDYFNGKTILITGGTGSIGSHLVKKLVQTNCKTIRVLTNNEHAKHHRDLGPTGRWGQVSESVPRKLAYDLVPHD